MWGGGGRGGGGGGKEGRGERGEGRGGAKKLCLIVWSGASRCSHWAADFTSHLSDGQAWLKVFMSCLNFG